MSEQTPAGGGRGDDPPEPQLPPPRLLPLDARTPYRYGPDDVEIPVLRAFGYMERDAFADAETRVQKAIRHGDHDTAGELRGQAVTHMARWQELNDLLRRRGEDPIVGPMVVIL